MAWWELRLTGLPRRDVDLASATLFDLGSAGVQEDWLPGTAPPPRQPWDTGPTPALPDRIVLRGWFEDPDRDVIDRAMTGFAGEQGWVPVEDVDWEAAWKAGFAPVVLTPRLTIAPPWDAPPGSVIVEPGQGFGSGAHPTTRMAAIATDELADGLRTALDVGCGSGVLAIIAARLGLDAEGVDVDEPSVRDAAANAARNDVSVRFSTTPVSELAGRRDLVLANLHAELIAALGPDLVRLTGQWLVLAGILEDREGLARAAIEPHLELVRRDTDGPWVGLRYRRRAP